VLDVLAAEFAGPNPAVKAVEYDIGAKQINNTLQHVDMCLFAIKFGS
jgi:hypothetical protein